MSKYTTYDYRQNQAHSKGDSIRYVTDFNTNSRTAGIQEAINDLPSQGGEIYLPAGLYTINTPLVPKSNLVLRGAGSSSIVKLGAGANTRMMSYTASGISNLVLSDLLFDGNGSNQTDQGDRDTLSAIYLSNVTNLRMRNLVIQSVRHGAAVRLGSCSDAVLTGNEFGVNGISGSVLCDQLYCGDCNAVSVANNYFGLTTDTGIAFDGVNYGTITGNNLVTVNSNGIAIAPSPTRAVKWVTVGGNVVYGPGFGYGIRYDVFNGSAQSQDVTIENNVVDNYQYGITVGAYSKNTVVQGNIVSATSDAIRVSKPGTGDITELDILHNNVRSATNGILFVGSAIASGRMIGNNLNGATNKVVGNWPTVTTVRDNKGYVTEAAGSASNVADGGTISHGLFTTPLTGVVVQATVAGEFASVTATGASTFTVAIKKHDGTAGTTQTIYWYARVV